MEKADKISLLLSAATVLILLLASYAYSHFSSQQQKYSFVIYGTEHCNDCRRLESFLTDEIGNDTILLSNLDDDDSSARFLEITSVLINSSIIQSPNCYECMSKEELGMFIDSLIPLTVILKNGDLRAVVAGFYSSDFWLRVLDRLGDGDSAYFLTPGTEAQIDDDVETTIEDILAK